MRKEIEREKKAEEKEKVRRIRAAGKRIREE